MKKIFVLIFLISIILVLSLVGLRNFGEKSNYQGEATLVISTLGKTTKEEVYIAGSNVFEILRKNHKIKVLQTSTSKRITCIDDVCAKNEFWWKFYVNDKLVLSSVDKYYPKDGDILLLEFGEEE